MWAPYNNKIILINPFQPLYHCCHLFHFHISIWVWVYVCVYIRDVTCLAAQSCLILFDPLDCSLPGSSIHGIFQARILEWAIISSSRGFPNPGIEWTLTSCILYFAGRFFTHKATGEALCVCVCMCVYDVSINIHNLIHFYIILKNLLYNK